MSCYPNNCSGNSSHTSGGGGGGGNGSICGDTDSIIYTGEDLTCTGIETGDNLSVVFQKLDEKYCEILALLENCNTTTTTSTTTEQGESCDGNSILNIFGKAPTTTSTTTKPVDPCNETPVCNPVGDLFSADYQIPPTTTTTSTTSQPPA